jgi:hypothetical protein
VTIVVALLAAAAFSGAVVVQQRAATRVGASFKLVLDPVWLLGGAIDACGFALQVIALHLGSVVEVQLLQVSVLPFGLLFGRVRLPGLAWASVAGVGLGLAGIIGATSPRPGPGHGGLELAVLVVAAVTALVLLATRGSEVRSAVGSAVCASMLFGTTATTVHVAGDNFTAHGLVGLLERPAVYLTAAVSATGLTLAQRAYASGPLALNLVVLTLLDPLVSLALGVLVAGDRLRGGGWIAAAVLAALVTTASVVVLSREEARVRRTYAAAPAPAGEPARQG